MKIKIFAVLGIAFSSLWLLTAAMHTPQQTLLVFGDSLSAAYGINQQESWVSLMQQRLQHHTPDTWQVHNASISGETTDSGLNRLPDLLSRYQPDIVLLELGGNDGLRGFPPNIIEENLRQMIRLIQLHDAEIVLIGIEIPPNYGERYTQRFSQIFADLAADYQLSFVPFLLDQVFDGDGMMQADGIHPTAAAQPYMLENVWPALEAVLQQ